MSAISEEEWRSYYSRKIHLLRRLQESWSRMSGLAPAQLVEELTDTASRLEELDEADRAWLARAGDASAPSMPLREELRAALTDASGALTHLRAKVEEMKDVVGKRLSDLRVRRRPPKHGEFDRRA